MTINPLADAEAEAAAHRTPERLEELSRLAQQLYLAQRQVEQAEGALKALKEEERTLRERTIPERMAEAGVRALKLANGWSLEVTPFITASLTGPVMPRAIAWLQASGHDGLIKREVTVAFGKGSTQEALALRQLLAGAGYAYQEKETVNTTSFKALIRELEAQGQLHTVPVDQVGVYMGKEAKLQSPTTPAVGA